MFSLITYNLITYLVPVLITNVSFVPDDSGHCSKNKYISFFFKVLFKHERQPNYAQSQRVSFSIAKSCINTSIFDNRHRGLNGHLSIRDSTLASCQKASYLHSNRIIIEKINNCLGKQHYIFNPLEQQQPMCFLLIEQKKIPYSLFRSLLQCTRFIWKVLVIRSKSNLTLFISLSKTIGPIRRVS